jgi:hypothetical protein
LLVDLTSFVLLAALGSHHAAITSLAFASVPDRHHAASAARQRPSSGHGVGHGTAPHHHLGGEGGGMSGHGGESAGAEGSLRLVTGSADGVLHVYALAPPNHAAAAAAAVHSFGSFGSFGSSSSSQLLATGAAAATAAAQGHSSGWVEGGSGAAAVVGCLPPRLLFSVRHVQKPLTWLGCPRDLPLLFCQV